VRTS
jgi:hypothetical protein